MIVDESSPLAISLDPGKLFQALAQLPVVGMLLQGRRIGVARLSVLSLPLQNFALDQARLNLSRSISEDRICQEDGAREILLPRGDLRSVDTNGQPPVLRRRGVCGHRLKRVLRFLEFLQVQVDVRTAGAGF